MRLGGRSAGNLDIMAQSATQLEILVGDDVQAPRRARHALADEFPCLGHALGDAEIVASELVTNAVLHGRRPIRVRALTVEGALRIEVSDSRPDVGPPTEASRGMKIIGALARDWGVLPSSGGKTVWAEIAAEI